MYIIFHEPSESNMYYTFLINILILISFWQKVHCQKSEFRLIKSAHCNVPGLKLLTENISINYHNSKGYINAQFHVTENIKALKKILLFIERRSRNSQGNHWEQFLNLKIERLCQTAMWENEYWSSIVKSVQPPFRCPIKPMTYEIQNASLDYDGMMNWYPDLSKYRWKTTSKLFNERNEVVCCEVMEFHIQECT